VHSEPAHGTEFVVSLPVDAGPLPLTPL
jgi:hypothetical protein